MKQDTMGILAGEDVIRQVYQAIELARLKLQPLVLEDMGDEVNGPGVPGGIAWEEENSVWCVLPDSPPILKGASFHMQKEIRNRWRDWITYAIHHAEIKKRFQHAVVLIKIYNPMPFQWDTDNRSIHAMINALRLSRLVEDDSWQHLSYMVTGQRDKGPPGTEIVMVERGDWACLIRALEAPRHLQKTTEKPEKTHSKSAEIRRQLDGDGENLNWTW